MTRFMRFWLRLGVVLGVPVVGFAFAATRRYPEDTGLLWGLAVGLIALYLGVGWAINAFFR